MKNNLAAVSLEARRSKASDNKTVQRIVQSSEDAKGRDITVLDVREVFGLSDYFVVVSGRSDRQVQGITNRIIDDLGSAGIHPVSVEGFEDGQWVLIDFGDIVVHVFYEPQRAFYDIESLWTEAKRIDVEPVSERLNFA